MRIDMNRISRKKSMGWLVILSAVMFLISGCEFIGSFTKEAQEEKKILGYVQGYNPRVKDIENLLKEEGFNPRSIDGIMDKGTRMAIRGFQKANKLKETGYINRKTQAKLNLLSIEKAKKKQASLAQQTKSRVKASSQTKKAQDALNKPLPKDQLK